MKKHLLTLIVGLLIGTFAQAQSLDLLDHDGNSIVGETVKFFAGQGEIVAHISVENLTSENKPVQARKIYLDIAENTDNYFCWGACLAFTVFETTNPVTIGASEIDESSFSGHYFPEDGVLAATTVRYEFFVDGSPSDMVWFIAKYTNDPYEAVGDNFASNTSVNAYPNPASNSVNIAYELPVDSKEAKLAVFNVLGNKVIEMPLNNVSGLEEVNISGLNNGMYFYSVMINNNLYGTKKLIVKN